MVYLITQLLLLLAIASLLSAAIGWLCRRFFTEQAHQREVDDHKRANRHYLNELDDLRRELTDRNTQVAGLTSKLHYNDEAIHQAEQERDALLNDIDTLRGIEHQLQSVEDERDHLDQALNTTKDELDAAMQAHADNIQQLQQALEEKDQALQQAENTNRNLDRQLDIASNNAENKEQQLTTALTGSTDKERQLQHAHDVIKDKDQQLQNSAAVLADNQKKLREAAVCSAESEEKLRAAETVNANLEDIISSLNNDIKNKSAERDRAVEKHAELAAELAALQQKLAQSVQSGNDRINDLENTLRRESDALALARQTIAAGEEKLKALEKQLHEAALERDRLEHKAADQQRKADELFREIGTNQKEAASERAANQNSIAKLEHELAGKNADLDGVTKELAHTIAANQGLNDEITGLKSLLKDVEVKGETQVAALAEQLRRQQHLTAESQSNITALEKQLADLKNERAREQDTAARQSDNLAKSEKQAARLGADVTNAKNRIADLESQLSDSVKGARSLQEQIDQLNAELGAKDSELQASVSNAQKHSESMAEAKSREVELLATINKLKAQLADERRLAGLSLLSRIKELEAMIDAERRKADELPTIDIGVVPTNNQTVLRRTAANAATVAEKNTG